MKNHHHNGPIHHTAKGLVHDGIAARAYELWLKAGQPGNQADEIWLQAERELVTGRSEPQRDPALPVSF